MVEDTKVRLDLAGENLDGSGLSDTVWSKDTGDLSGDRLRKTVEDKGVWSVSVDRGVKLLRELDDIECFERALLNADTASDAKLLGDDRTVVFSDSDGLVTGSDAGTVDDTFVCTLLCVTAVFVNDSESHAALERKEVDSIIVQERNQVAKVMNP